MLGSIPQIIHAINKYQSTTHQRLNPVVLCNREFKLKCLAHHPLDSALGGCAYTCKLTRPRDERASLSSNYDCDRNKTIETI